MGVTRQPATSPGDRFSTRIVIAVADARDTDPTELAPALSDVVDPDALDRLLRSASGEATVEFGYAGLTVTASADGTITLADPDDDS